MSRLLMVAENLINGWIERMVDQMYISGGIVVIFGLREAT